MIHTVASLRGIDQRARQQIHRRHLALRMRMDCIHHASLGRALVSPPPINGGAINLQRLGKLKIGLSGRDEILVQGHCRLLPHWQLIRQRSGAGCQHKPALEEMH